MKTYKILTLLSLTITALISCKKETKIPEYAIVKGHIAKKVTDTFSIYLDGTLIKKISIKNNSKFNDTIPLKIAQLYMFGNKESAIPLYVSPGSVIDLDIIGADLEKQITFKGDYALIYTYHQNKIDIEKNYKTYYNKWINEKTHPDEDYKTLALEIESLQNKLTQNLSKYKNLPTHFYDLEKRLIKYNVLLQFLTINKFMEVYNVKIDLPPFYESSKKEMKQLALDNENDYKISQPYKFLVSTKYNDQVRILSKKDTTKSWLENNIEVYKTIPQTYIREDLIAYILQSSIHRAKDVETAKTIYNAYENLITDKGLKASLNTTLKGLNKLAKGTISPNFANYENYNGTKTSLDDFKGKYVYIDVWATWCAPCINEIPYLKKLEKEYHGKNIEFVSISVDAKADHDKWKSFVKKENLSGTQLFADNSFNSSFIQAYVINAIPRFILISPKGEIIASKALRPSKKGLKVVLDNLENI